MTGRNTRPNPYVGPRPFTARDPLPARRREVRELRSLLVAERVVLLHSPSGAGKTSLLEGQGGLKHALGEQFHVRPTIRVHQPLPPGVAGNRYRLSVLRSLEEAPGPGGPLPPAELAGLSLAAYLERRRAELATEVDGEPRTRRELLIFDQFEEVLSADPRDEAGRAEFFAELRDVLGERRRWALLAIREDFLGALQPWFQALPTQLARRFRIDLLGEEGAREAIRAPAAAQGVGFDADALDHLVGELLQTRAQGPDGEPLQRRGLWIEPVQLQVVCRRLWSRLAADDMNIERAEVADLGDVDAALAEFYAEQVRAIAARRPEATERAIREWIGARLISIHGARTQVMKGERSSDGLANAVIEALQDVHIIRAEERRGVKWYELAHDRLVGPVRRDNEAWAREHLHPMQLRAALWAQQQEPRSLLLDAEALRAAAAWAKSHAAALTAVERRFLVHSQEQLARGRAARTAALAVAAAVAAVVVGVLASFAWQAKGVAEREKAEAVRERERAEAAGALAREEAARADAAARQAREASLMAGARELLAAGQTGLATRLLLAVEAPGAARGWAELVDAALTAPVAARTLPDTRLAAWSPRGDRLLTVSEAGAAQVWPADGTGGPRAVEGHRGPVPFAAWSADGRVALASADGTVWLWSEADGARVLGMSSGSPRSLVWSPDRRHLLTTTWDATALWRDDATDGPVARLAGESTRWSPDGRRVLGRDDDAVRVWSVEAPGAPVVLRGAAVTDAAWSPDGLQVVTGADDGAVRVWSADGRGRPRELRGHAASLVQVAWSPDGRRIVTVDGDDTARVWSVDGGPPTALPQVQRATWSPDGQRLLLLGDDETARVWSVTHTHRAPVVLAGHAGVIQSAAWSPDGQRVVTLSSDRTARVWSADGKGEPAVLRGHTANFASVEWNPDGRRILLRTRDGVARVWQTETEPRVLRGLGPLQAVAWSPDGRRVVTGSTSGTLRIDATDGPGESLVLAARTEPVTAVAWSPDGRRIVAASRARTAEIWPADGGPPTTLAGHEGPVWAAAWSPDGRRVVTASEDRTARVWTVDGTDAPVVLAGHRGAVRSAAWRGDGRRIVTGADDGTARVWQVDRPDAPLFVLTHDGAVRSVGWSADGRKIVAVVRPPSVTDGDPSVQIWDAETPGAPTVLGQYATGLRSAAWSPDGAHLMVLSDRTAEVWDAALTGKPRVLRGHAEELLAAAWSADGQRLATVSGDGSARLWSFHAAALRSALQAATADCLPAELRRVYLIESDAAARAGHEACERSHGRTPRPPREDLEEVGTRPVEVRLRRVLGEACGAGSRHVTPDEARNDRRLCEMLGHWDIVRLAGGGALDGPGYGCQVRTSDERAMGTALCVTGDGLPPPEAPDPDGPPQGWRMRADDPGDGDYRFHVVPGAACPAGSRIATAAEADDPEACGQIGSWDLVRLADGLAIGGRGHGCRVAATDPADLDETLCMVETLLDTWKLPADLSEPASAVDQGASQGLDP